MNSRILNSRHATFIVNLEAMAATGEALVYQPIINGFGLRLELNHAMSKLLIDMGRNKRSQYITKPLAERPGKTCNKTIVVCFIDP